MTRPGNRRRTDAPGLRWAAARSLVAAALLSGCAGPGSQTRSTEAARAACRAHADNVFEQQNKDAVYRSDTYSTQLRDSPFGSSGMPGLPTFGLSQQFGVQTTMQNCLNGTGDLPATTEDGPPSPTPLTNGPRPAAAK
jgi:hypothetical protein